MKHHSDGKQHPALCLPTPQPAALSCDTPIDFSKDFLPEHFTPLFYTPLYSQLTAPQRRRYNQLHACYSNEQIMFFEQTMAPHILPALQLRSLPVALATDLHDFLAEEQRHTQMFKELNKRCFPHFYATQDFYFVQVPRGVSALLAWAGQRPGLFACLLWMMLLEEERAVMMGRDILRCGLTLEPNFVDLQRHHLRDEIGHVQWDEALLDVLWESLPRPLRQMNAVLLRWMLGEFFVVPKRSNMRVVAQLAREFPELQGLLPQCQRALRALKDCPVWHTALYSRRVVPKTFARFDAYPEMHAVQHVLHGYRPGAS